MEYCAALYNHTNLRNGDRIFPCCRYKKPIQRFDGDVQNILFSKEYQDLRKNWSLNDSNCAKCLHEETLGRPSLRQWFNKNYSTDEIKLRYFEVGFDNICDLACDGCWEEWSSSWWVKKNPNLPAKQGITSTTELRNVSESIEKVVFLGGEPLMTNRHRRFLESFDTLEHLEVEYFTNGMHGLKEEDYSLLNKCKSVHFTVSIDGYGSLNEKVRSGSVWNTVVNTLDEIAKTFDYTIHTTLHKNNWYGLPELSNWTKNYSKWTINVLTYPKHLDIINLQDSDKSNLLEFLEIYQVPDRQYIKAHLKGEQ